MMKCEIECELRGDVTRTKDRGRKASEGTK